MMGFTYDTKNSNIYKAYTTAKSTFNDIANNSKKYGYNKYQSDVDSLYDAVMNYGDFSYDMEKDQLFQMYKQQYQSQGNTAMRNQMGISTAKSGGYNSSVAQTSAQSVYQNYMDALSEKAADTYQNAYDMWNTEYNNKLNQYNSAVSANEASNSNYWNLYNAAQTQKNTAYDAYQDDKNFKYTKWNDNRNYNLAKKQYTG
jgi:hypothetical protein